MNLDETLFWPTFQEIIDSMPQADEYKSLELFGIKENE